MLCCKMQKQVHWRPLVVKYVYCASIQLPNILVLCFEGRDGNCCLGRGNFRASRSCTPSWHRDLQPCSALPPSPSFFFFWLVLSQRWVAFWGGRVPLSALMPPWCHIQTAPGKVTSAELYLAAGLIMHLNSQSGLAEMILSPNDVFPLMAMATSPSGLIFQQQSTGDAATSCWTRASL